MVRDTDISLELDFSVLRRFKGLENETYLQFVTRLRNDDDPDVVREVEAYRALLDAIVANPDLPWTRLFGDQDLSCSTFTEPVVYVNFERIHGSGLLFAADVEGWFGNADMTGMTFEAAVRRSNFTGAWLPQIRFGGPLERNALNGSYLVDGDFLAVTTADHNDLAFARLDGAVFSAATDWSTSVFTGAVSTGATNAPAGAPLIPAIDPDDLAMAVFLLGGPSAVQDLADHGGLLNLLVALGEPYRTAFSSRLPESWRSYLADALGDGGGIKPEVYDAVDGRYGAQQFVPTLTSLHDNLLDPRARQFIDQKLVEMLLGSVRTDDPMGLKGSATGRSFSEWVAYVSSTSVAWQGGTRWLYQHPIPRETLYVLYANMDPTMATRLRTGLDDMSSFTLAELFAAGGTYPGAAEALYELYR
jgi:hypothetical protein